MSRSAMSEKVDGPLLEIDATISSVKTDENYLFKASALDLSDVQLSLFDNNVGMPVDSLLCDLIKDQIDLG